jgi:DNA polymerase III epsilon subunit family exonuclease
LRACGGSAPESALIAHVFGTVGSAALWTPLLRSMLGRDPLLTLRADGIWMIVEERPVAVGGHLDEFVAVDVETTGLRPARQRIVEVAVVRFAEGREVERFESLVNPGRRLPKYIADLTGIADIDLAEAPTFAAVADRVLQVLGEGLLVGHNVGFDISFLDAELARLDRPRLTNERLDTMGLAGRLLPQVRRPSLEAVAEKLGVIARPSKVHRAGQDATIAALVAMKLAEHARQAGYASLDEVKGLGTRLPERPRQRHPRGRADLDRAMLAGVPKAAGVYLMKNAFGEIVYVGKAKNLRDRVGSYFSQQLGYTRKMDGLLESLAAIETVVVGNELQALLLESQLIRRYQPRYNTALRSHEQYPFIRVDVATAWPRITLAKSRKNDGARYFGPFRSASSARRTVDLLNRVVPLRTCSRSFRDARSYGSPCIELDLGRCLGPCVGRADRDTYRALVRDVVAYLDGHDDALYQLLWKGLEEAAEKLDFEKAEKLRRELRDAGAVVGSQRRIREATETGRCLLVLPAEAQGERDLLLIAGGRIWAQLRMGTEDGRTDFGGRLLRSWERLRAAGLPTIDHDSVDEAHILHRWLVRQGRLPGLIRLSDEPNWEAVVDAILALRDEDLPVDFRRLEEMDEALDVPTEEPGVDEVVSAVV